MHRTINGREIHFVGEQSNDIKAINSSYDNIQTLDDLFELLLQCYEKQTAYPPCQEFYNYITNPTSGQCAITSVIVQEIFGGTIHETTVTKDMTHLFNIISGEIIDLTCDQFTLDGIMIDYEANKEVKREECLANENTRKRFDLLKKKLINKIKSLAEKQER